MSCGGRMSGAEFRQALEERLGHLVDRLVLHARMGDEVVDHRRRRDRRGLAVVGVGRDRDLDVGRADLVDDGGRHLHDGDLDRGRQIADRGDAEAGRLQGRVELAVLHQLDRLGEGQVLDLAEILVGQAGAGEDRAGVELGAGFRRADREALALEIGQRLDAANPWRRRSGCSSGRSR